MNSEENESFPCGAGSLPNCPLTVILARIDERTRTVQMSLTEMKILIANTLVTREEFEPVKRLVYGATGIIMVAVIGALLGLVITRP